MVMLKTFFNYFRSSSLRLKPIAGIMSEGDTEALTKVRYDGRVKKRQWEDRRTDKGDGLEMNDRKRPKDENAVEKDEEFQRIKRRKHVLLLGYSGVDYFGMQRNPKTRTIEEELLKALLKTNLITEEGYNQVQQMQFQRAARTDKGVSAARQVVSLKFPENVDVKTINDELPEVIRVFSINKVTKGFNSKSQCDSRTYMYMLPTVAFASQTEEVTQKGYRVSEEILQNVNEVLKLFLGTKNFHNFTSKKSPNDPSSHRYIKSFVCEKPFVKDDVEFAVLKVQGQSFMLHQIRKMVALMLAVVRNHTTKDTLLQAFAKEKLNIPRAPGLGLVLEFVHYDRYNNRYGGDGMHGKLSWEDVDQEVNDFKEKHIYPTIISREIENEEMVDWIQFKLQRHRYDVVDDSKDDKSDDEEDEDVEDEDDSKKLEKSST